MTLLQVFSKLRQLLEQPTAAPLREEFFDLGRVAAAATTSLRALADTPEMRKHAVMTRALEVRQNRNTGPRSVNRP